MIFFSFSLKLTSSSIDPGLNIKELGGLYINFNADKLQPHKKTLSQIKEKKKNEVSYMNCPIFSPWKMTTFPKAKHVFSCQGPALAWKGALREGVP